MATLTLAVAAPSAAATPAGAAPQPTRLAVGRGATQRSRIQCKQEMIVMWLQEYFALPGNLERILPLIDPDAPAKSPVSLRLVDWFCTNYAKKNNVAYVLDGRQFLVYSQYKRELKAYSKRLFDPFCRRERISFQARGHAPIKTTIGQLNFFRWALDKGVLPYVEQHRDTIESDMNTSIREHYAKGTAPSAAGPAGAAAGGSGASTASTRSTASSGSGGTGSLTLAADGAATIVTRSATSASSGTRSTSGRRRRSELSQSAMKKVNHHVTDVVVTFD
jgi:hypothetical protein